MASRSEILDACALINLYASGFMGEIISSRQAQCYVVEQALQESLFIRRPSDTGVGFDKEPVKLDSYFQNKMLQTVKLESEAEQNLFVDLALQIDDGEAATIAIAISRHMQVATDDKKAVRILKQEAPDIVCFSTLEVIKAWSEKLSVNSEQMKVALSSILKHANYRPGKGHKLFEWWQNTMNS
jgi:predicted nucleic acid-binding protein